MLQREMDKSKGLTKKGYPKGPQISWKSVRRGLQNKKEIRETQEGGSPRAMWIQQRRATSNSFKHKYLHISVSMFTLLTVMIGRSNKKYIFGHLSSYIKRVHPSRKALCL